MEIDSEGSVTLTLLATGMRGRQSLDSVSAAAGGVNIPVLSVESHCDYPGYDQVVLGPLPEAARGLGAVDLAVVVDGHASNPVRIRIR